MGIRKWMWNLAFWASAISLMGTTVGIRPVKAAINLTTGDIAFTGYNSDNPDQFSFVLLVDVDADTAITFTDNG